MSKEKDKGWNDIIFSTIEKIAQAPGKIKDSKEPVATTLELLKGLKEDLQSRVDMDQFAKKIAQHIADNFDIEISLKPKGRKGKSKSDD